MYLYECINLCTHLWTFNLHTNNIKQSYPGFIQEHLWALLHIEHDKHDETTTKQSGRGKCSVDGISVCHSSVNSDRRCWWGRWPCVPFGLSTTTFAVLPFALTFTHKWWLVHLLLFDPANSSASANWAQSGIKAEMSSRHSSWMEKSVCCISSDKDPPVSTCCFSLFWLTGTTGKITECCSLSVRPGKRNLQQILGKTKNILKSSHSFHFAAWPQHPAADDNQSVLSLEIPSNCLAHQNSTTSSALWPSQRNASHS